MNTRKIRKLYEAPAIKKAFVQSNKSVAEQCWGESDNIVHYYDSAGHGFVKFTVNAPNCKSWSGVVDSPVFTCILNESGKSCDQMTDEAASIAIDEFHAAFKKRFDEVANGGSSYKGFSKDFPVDPHGMS